MTEFPTISTTFSSVDNTFRISFGPTTFTIPMAYDLQYYISKTHVKQLLTYVNDDMITLNVIANVFTAFTNTNDGKTPSLWVSSPIR